MQHFGNFYISNIKKEVLISRENIIQSKILHIHFGHLKKNNYYIFTILLIKIIKNWIIKRLGTALLKYFVFTYLYLETMINECAHFQKL